MNKKGGKENFTSICISNMQDSSKKWWILMAMCLIYMMLSIDATALNIAIPVISHEFKASLSNMQWVINVFFLFAALVQILGGHLGDSYGHKKIFLISLAFFIMSSLGAGLSTNENMLIAFRALQGASVGITSPLTMVLIFEAFPQKMQSFARSFLVAIMGISLAAGAPIGGLFVHTIGWRWIFYINIPLGLICFFVTWLYCKSSKKTPHCFDIKGTIYLIIALFAITYGINEVQNLGFSSPWFILLILIGLSFIYLLYLHERKQTEPIVNFELFKKRRFLINNILRIINQIIFLAILFFMPLYLQNIALETAIISGLTMLTLTLSMFFVSPSIGKWIDRKGEYSANTMAMILLIVASCFLFFLKPIPNFYLLCISLILFGIAISTLYSSTTTGALSVATKEKMGSVTGLFFTIAWLACALGVSVSGIAIAYGSRSILASSLPKEMITEQLQRVSQGLSPLSSLQNSNLENIAAKSFTNSIHIQGWIFLILSLIGLILSIFQKRQLQKEVAPQNIVD